ncbi:(+)-neomenthol dehydrogenase-like [Senna tora]|uniref:(+)-neomenthol dehydrogenase-like n=1 Tax=Senna tora TaxID=362788 RepID=A0A834SSI3_9FABA|nr:(+)-neomenthol dehydrogenase-like [Senna tora]
MGKKNMLTKRKNRGGREETDQGEDGQLETILDLRDPVEERREVVGKATVTVDLSWRRRIAVVSGSNKGIGLETVKQLVSTGVKIVLTARDEKKGLEALESLRELGFSDEFVVFHQLDVADAASVTSLAHFIKSQFGKLDILVNNAGVNGVIIGVKMNLQALSEDERKRAISETYELCEECFEINYYGAKRTVEALLPLLQLSDSPTIVNVSSLAGTLQILSNEWAKGVLSDVEKLTEESINEVVTEFLKDFKEGSHERKGWPKTIAAYKVSKVVMNAYTRILAMMYPKICINCVCPGYVRTDITSNTGFSTVEEGASKVVKLALLPNGSPSGFFYSENEISHF